ncbi:MAG: threonine/serine exporter family protein [Lachnospiraceae bacterium]|nr:threonine/serine exporter family protein [Lachnospiraceae bacterium]
MSRILFQMVAAFGGTVGFSILYNTPKKHFLWAGLTGTLGWMCYLVLQRFSYPLFSCFGAALIVGIAARILAVRRQCPVIIFAIAGLFPLVPGVQIYYVIYYLMTDELSQAIYQGVETLKVAMAIVMGIIVALSIPQKWFMLTKKRK